MSVLYIPVMPGEVGEIPFFPDCENRRSACFFCRCVCICNVKEHMPVMRHHSSLLLTYIPFFESLSRYCTSSSGHVFGTGPGNSVPSKSETGTVLWQ